VRKDIPRREKTETSLYSLTKVSI